MPTVFERINAVCKGLEEDFAEQHEKDVEVSEISSTFIIDEMRSSIETQMEALNSLVEDLNNRQEELNADDDDDDNSPEDDG